MQLIATPEQIRSEAQGMQEFLEPDTLPDDINVIEERGHEIAAYIARSGKLLADAKYHQDKKKSESILKQLDSSLPALALNELIKAECREENYLVNWMDRINRALTHQLDWLRSCLSKAKAEMQNFG